MIILQNSKEDHYSEHTHRFKNGQLIIEGFELKAIAVDEYQELHIKPEEIRGLDFTQDHITINLEGCYFQLPIVKFSPIEVRVRSYQGNELKESLE